MIRTERWMALVARGVATGVVLVTAAFAPSFVLGQGSNASPSPRGRPAVNRETWVTAWGTSQHVPGDTPITNATVRMIARVTHPGRHGPHPPGQRRGSARRRRSMASSTSTTWCGIRRIPISWTCRSTVETGSIQAQRATTRWASQST